MKILVIGDSCKDIFRYGKVNRLAPEAPVPIIIPEREISNLGMAGNVVTNLKALGAELTVMSDEQSDYIGINKNILTLMVTLILTVAMIS